MVSLLIALVSILFILMAQKQRVIDNSISNKPRSVNGGSYVNNYAYDSGDVLKDLCLGMCLMIHRKITVSVLGRYIELELL